MRAVARQSEGQLRPGQFVRARCLRRDAARTRSSCRSARCCRASKSHFVWVVDKDSKAHQRVVEVGDWHGDDWFINEGCKPGERIVVDGAIRVVARRAAQDRQAPPPSRGAGRAAPARRARAGRRKAGRASPTAERTERTGAMNISHFCIDRPIFASVISIVITLGGAVAMLGAAGRAVSRHHAAADHGLRHLSRRRPPTSSRTTSPRRSSSRSTARTT